MPELKIKTPADIIAEIRELVGEALHRIESARAAVAYGGIPDHGAVITSLETAEARMDDLDEALA